jgi:crotonobetainyl-CoA:carnitine CoA-transferase CaiB-like acyl-CoA transferase
VNAELPLEGLTVLDLSRLLPGPFCSLLLADFGADVIKVEDLGIGDYIRWSPPYYDGPVDSAKGARFLALNRGKRSIRINLKSEPGKEVLLRLARVYCAVTGYGLDGPNRDRSGHDMNYLGLNGLLGLTGERDGPPVQSAGQIADIGGGALMAALGILIALRERERSGEGQLVDCSMFDGSLAWLAMVAADAFATGQAPRRGDLQLAGRYICYRPYECADGYVSLGALEPKFWQAWCEGVGRPELVENQFDPADSDAHRAVTEIFRQRTREQWRAFASEHDCCLEPVLDFDEVLDSELVRAREMIVALDQPGAEEPIRQLGVPIKLDRTPARPGRTPGPALGEHTEEVLAGAGYGEPEIAALLEAGAVAGATEHARGSFMGG